MQFNQISWIEEKQEIIKEQINELNQQLQSILPHKVKKLETTTVTTATRKYIPDGEEFDNLIRRRTGLIINFRQNQQTNYNK